jgi:hypothetical protein
VDYEGASGCLRSSENFEKVRPFSYFFGIFGSMKDLSVTVRDEDLLPPLIGIERFAQLAIDCVVIDFFHRRASLRLLASERKISATLRSTSCLAQPAPSPFFQPQIAAALLMRRTSA